MPILNGIIWAFLRRWYGGMFEDKFGGRGIQTFLMISGIFSSLYGRADLEIILFLAVWIQLQFWSRAVGEILDCGRSKNQDKNSYDRWFRVPLDYIYDKFGKEKYTGNYDWWYMWMRYTFPMIIPAAILFDFSFIIIGLFSSPIYYGCWYIFDKFPKLWNSSIYVNQPKNIAEILYGFVFGLLIY